MTRPCHQNEGMTFVIDVSFKQFLQSTYMYPSTVNDVSTDVMALDQTGATIGWKFNICVLPCITMQDLEVIYRSQKKENILINK